MHVEKRGEGQKKRYRSRPVFQGKRLTGTQWLNSRELSLQHGIRLLRKAEAEAGNVELTLDFENCTLSEVIEWQKEYYTSRVGIRLTQDSSGVYCTKLDNCLVWKDSEVVQARDINSNHINRLIQALKKSHLGDDKNRKNFKREVQQLKQMLTRYYGYAGIKRENPVLSEHNEMAEIAGRNEEDETQAMTIGELKGFLQELQTITQPHQTIYYDLAVVMSFAGLRRGEALGLKRQDLNVERGTLAIQRQVVYTNKNGPLVKTKLKTRSSRRTIRVGEKVINTLLRLSGSAVKSNNGLLFHTGSKFLPKNTIRSLWGLAFKQSGLSLSGTHTARKAFATNQIFVGVPLADVSLQLGHTDPEITMKHYLDREKAVGPDGARMLEDAFNQI